MASTKKYLDLGEGQIHSTCSDTSECPNGYFCYNNDCVAKKREHATCLSGLDEECHCGKCTVDVDTWTQVCASENESCHNEGIHLTNLKCNQINLI